MRVANTKSHYTKSAMSWLTMWNWQKSMHAASTTNFPGSKWCSSHATASSQSLHRKTQTKGFFMSTSTRIDNAALFAILSSLADNKQAIGRRYAYWCNGAPALEAAVAAAAMTQDELGHARTLYPLLDNFRQAVADPRQVEPETRTLLYALAFLDQDFQGWTDFVATNFLLDTALTTFFEAAQNSSYEPLRQRARKILQEERIHQMHAEGWIRRLAKAGGAVRTALI